MGEPPPGESHPDGTEQHQNDSESILISENNVEQRYPEEEVGERKENGFSRDEFIPERLDSINSYLEHTDSNISIALERFLENTNSIDSLSNDDYQSELIDYINSESEQTQINFNHYMNSNSYHIINTSNNSLQPTNLRVAAPLPASPEQDVIPAEQRNNSWKIGDNPVSLSDFGNHGMSGIYDDLPYSPDEDQAMMVGDRDQPNLSDIGGHVNLSRGTIPSVSQVGDSDIPIMAYLTALYPEINGDNYDLLPDGDGVSMESSSSGSHTPSLQEGNHMIFPGPGTVTEGSHINVPGPDTVTEGSHINVPGPDTVPEGSYINVPGPGTVPEGSYINVPGPGTVTEGSHINVPGPGTVTSIDMHSEVNNGDHLQIPDGDNVDMESRTCTSGNHCRSLEEVNCDSISVDDVVTTGSEQISADTIINVPYHPLPQFANQACLSAIGARVQTSGTSDGAVPTVLHQVTGQYSTISLNALAMIPVVLTIPVQHNLENTANPNNWNHVVTQDNNAHVWQSSASQNSDEEKKRKRREQNRVSSRECRKRQRELEEKLFAEEEELFRENARLRGEIESLSKKIEKIKKDLEKRKD